MTQAALKVLFTSFVLLSLACLPAMADVLAPIARTDDGQAFAMNRVDALKYCDDHGGRLPTIRELAGALNPGGLSDSPKPGHLRIDADGEAPFYYNFNAYTPPSSDEAAYMYWSASNGEPLADAEPFGYVFWARNASISAESSVYQRAEARCLTP